MAKKTKEAPKIENVRQMQEEAMRKFQVELQALQSRYGVRLVPVVVIDPDNGGLRCEVTIRPAKG